MHKSFAEEGEVESSHRLASSLAGGTKLNQCGEWRRYDSLPQVQYSEKDHFLLYLHLNFCKSEAMYLVEFRKLAQNYSCSLQR